MLPDKATVDAVLADINRVRALISLPPVYAILPGYVLPTQQRTLLCPIARTINYGNTGQPVRVSAWATHNGLNTRLQLPTRELIHALDVEAAMYLTGPIPPRFMTLWRREAP